MRTAGCASSRDLGVKNGVLGTVEKAEPGRLEIRLDSARGPGRVVSVSMADYAAVDHGYATTIQKDQDCRAAAAKEKREAAQSADHERSNLSYLIGTVKAKRQQ